MSLSEMDRMAKAANSKKSKISLEEMRIQAQNLKNIQPSQIEEESLLIDYALSENLIFSGNISEDLFISEGAEQKVCRFDDHSVIKLNESVFYEYWLDYFSSLLIHNYFF